MPVFRHAMGLLFAALVFLTGSAWAQDVDLSLTHTVNNSTPNVGDTVIFTITLSNAGHNSASNVRMRHVLPTGLSYVSAIASQNGGTGRSFNFSNGIGNWQLNTVTSSAPATLTITAHVSSANFLTHTASIYGSDPLDPDTTDHHASVTIEPRPLLTVTAPPDSVPGMSGQATATLSGGGSTCTLISATFGAAAQTPPQLQVPHGQFSFTADGCTDPGPVTMTLHYPEPLPVGVKFRKLGSANVWLDPEDPATSINLTLTGDRRTVTYHITDNGPGDSDSTLGRIVDPLVTVMPLAAGGGSGAVGIPVDAPWALGALSALLAALGWRAQRRRACAA